ncbi:MAG: hypothetical protein A2W08_03830 [Candidatus Rokubacteria bacterium RBG_16_73_20]|nr:MAG: hypothetical protein A2W08_03830 [Candidatus Rokubacteria bacterium RBG_16_73_20]
MRRTITARKTSLQAAGDAFDREFWSQVRRNERFAEAWRLREEIWRLKGWDPGEPGLSRSAARLVRRGR